MSDPTKAAFDTLRLWDASVIVLFDWLMSVDLDAIPTTHPAQRQALVDLLTSIERDTAAPHATHEQIADAQMNVARASN